MPRQLKSSKTETCPKESKENLEKADTKVNTNKRKHRISQRFRREMSLLFASLFVR